EVRPNRGRPGLRRLCAEPRCNGGTAEHAAANARLRLPQACRLRLGRKGWFQHMPPNSLFYSTTRAAIPLSPPASFFRTARVRRFKKLSTTFTVSSKL